MKFKMLLLQVTKPLWTAIRMSDYKLILLLYKLGEWLNRARFTIYKDKIDDLDTF